MEISPRRLAVLLAVHRNGGVVAAADALYMSPSAVSQQIRLLEKEVGTRVLDREPSGAVLTYAGRILAEAAENIETEITAAQKALLAADRSSLTGTVRVGAFITAIRTLLMPMLAQMSQSLPGVELVIEEIEEKEGNAALRKGQLDLLLLERDETDLTPPPRGQAAVPILDESWLVAVPPNSPVPNTLADLAREDWIDVSPYGAGHAALLRLGQQAGAPLQARHIIFDYDVALEMVEQNLGCALLPELAVRGGRIPDSITVTKLPGLGTRQLIARHRSTRTEPDPSTKAVLDMLIAQAGRLGEE